MEDEPDDIAIFIVFQASRDVGLERGVSLSGGEKVTPASVERVLKEIRERVDGAAAFILDETGGTPKRMEREDACEGKNMQHNFLKKKYMVISYPERYGEI